MTSSTEPNYPCGTGIREPLHPITVLSKKFGKFHLNSVGIFSYNEKNAHTHIPSLPYVPAGTQPRWWQRWGRLSGWPGKSWPQSDTREEEQDQQHATTVPRKEHFTWRAEFLFRRSTTY